VGTRQDPVRRPEAAFRVSLRTIRSRGFRVFADGRYLYGSSYYTGVSNIFRYEVATGEVEAVTNAETGFFRPVPLADGRLVVLHYTGQGFVPAIIEPRPIKDVSAITFLGAEVAEKYPVVKTWQVPPPSTVDEEKLVTARGPYLPLRSLGLANAYPVLQGYKNTAGFGYHVNIGIRSSSRAWHHRGVHARWRPARQRARPRRHRRRYGFWKGELSWNRSDFYDLFGPTKRSRKGYAAKVGYDWLLILDKPERLDLLFDFAYYDKIDTLPTAQNVSTTFDRMTTRSRTPLHRRAALARRGRRREGRQGALVYYGSRVNGEVTPQVHGELDWGYALPLAHSSVWLRSAAGFANGDRNSTVANFYSAASATTTSTTRRSSAIASTRRCPDSGSTRSARCPSCARWSNGTCRRSCWRRRVRRLLPDLAAAVGLRAGLWANPGNAALRQEYASVGAQTDSTSASCTAMT